MNILLIAAVAASGVCSEPRKLGPYFYEVNCDGYVAEPLLRHMETLAPKLPRGGCSGFRDGNFHGRNMDWTVDTVNYYLVRVPEKAERFASIGIAMEFFAGKSDFLPWTMMDGINSQGGVVQVNVVPTGDRGLTASTKPGAPRMAGFMLVRYLLDRARSAEHAVELVKALDLFGNGKNEMHWMVSDAKETFVIEVVNNRIQVAKHPIMTNFYLTESPYVKKEGVFTKGSAGIERYERLKRHVGKIDSAADMLAAMKEEWYSQAYAPGRELEWWSEFNEIEWSDPDTGKKWRFSYDDGGKDDPESEAFAARMKYMKETQAKFAAMREAEKTDGRQDTGYWQSVESGCYDIENRTLSIYMQEREPLFVFRLREKPRY